MWLIQVGKTNEIKLTEDERRRWAYLGLDMDTSRDTQVVNEWDQDACLHQLFSLSRGSCLF